MRQIAATDATNPLIVAEQSDIAALNTALAVLVARVTALEAKAGIAPPPVVTPPPPTASFTITAAKLVAPEPATPPFQVSVTAPGMLNVEVSVLEGFLARAVPDPASGIALITVTANPLLVDGAETLYINAWDSPAGQAFTHHDSTTLPVTITGATPVQPVTPPPSAPPPVPTGVAPASGLTGWTLASEWAFGSGGIETVAGLQAVFASSLPWGRINGEMQVYTDFNPNNIQIVNGELLLIATPTRGIGDQQIDSAELVSHMQLSNQPSLLEFCIKAPAGLGMWPAGWRYGVFPQGDSSEIDDFEIVFNAADGSRDTTHGVFVNDHLSLSTTEPGSLLDQWGKWVAPFDFAAGFHTMATCWQGGMLTRYCDQTKLVTRAGTWTGSPPNIILNLACGSVTTDWPGRPNAASFQNGANILAVRFIRLWKPTS